MKPRNSIASAAVAAVIASIVAPTAFAGDQYSENSGMVRLLELASGTATESAAAAAPTQPAPDPTLYSEGGAITWLAQLANGSAEGAAAPSASVLACGHLLKDGSTVHIFPDGRMGMEDRFGRPFSMDEGQAMEAADGRKIIMKGNEVWRTDELLFGNSRGA